MSVRVRDEVGQGWLGLGLGLVLELALQLLCDEITANPLNHTVQNHIVNGDT